jgi:MOSC domain-containing protein YiiM
MMGMVVSVNVGLPQDVAWQGRTVRTAIWKKPVTGRIFAGRLNLDGDGQGDLGGHGGEHGRPALASGPARRHPLRGVASARL